MDEITKGLLNACKTLVAAIPNPLHPARLQGQAAIDLAALGHVPRRPMTSEKMANDFIALIEAGYIHPELIASVLYAMHAAMLDRFETVALWLPVDLEQAADDVVKAIGCAERQEQDHPEEVVA